MTAFDRDSLQLIFSTLVDSWLRKHSYSQHISKLSKGLVRVAGCRMRLAHPALPADAALQEMQRPDLAHACIARQSRRWQPRWMCMKLCKRSCCRRRPSHTTALTSATSPRSSR